MERRQNTNATAERFSEYGWLPPWKLREQYVEPVAVDADDAQTRLYLAVVTGQVRARFEGRTLSLKQITLMSDIKRLRLPPDIELSVVDARRKWGSPCSGSRYPPRTSSGRE